MRSAAARRAAPLCLHLLLASGLAAADLTGFWIGTIAQRGRTFAKDVAFQFVQEGAALGGKAYNDRGSSDAILRGSVDGGRVAFEVEVLEQGGNEINIVVYKFRGTVAGEEIELTRERAALRNAANGTEIPVRRKGDSDEQDRERRFRSFRLGRL